ncbi:pyruvate dehydrogenase (acetyl-transferring) E1 component subunit alpha [Halomicrococcus sp. NG-SE-24]|uniref:pyruvate dehydrogenase (acetyl-transferring) E1 component subunit alpha n=1 Tax=Halomicrococcus sp. NG-SE-24 TaxID=3436928 RepID=UPI003D964387
MASQAPDVTQVVAPDGTVDGEVELSAEDARNVYRLQVLARTFDEKAVSLHRQGRIGTYAPLKGQEAAQVGAAYALSTDDYCFPTYRDHAMYLTRGHSMRDVLLHLLGAGNYVDREDPDGLRTFTPTIPIATQLPHAVGVGMAADYDGDDAAALASFGDGATSEGDFHEAMNFAGVFDAPVVFFCQNNQYAISVPRERQTASATIAQKADAYGFDGMRIDGNDVFAVYRAVTEALERARRGEPVLIEAVTYRQGAHTTTDDPSKYREEAEVEEWVEKDPIERTREFLEAEHGWTDEDEAALREDCEARVAEAVEAAEAHDGFDTDAMFDHVYADEHPRHPDQRETVPDDPQVER